LDEEINIINPDVISTLGYYSAAYIFKKYKVKEKLVFSEVCGNLFQTHNKKIYPLRHPAMLLYKPEKKVEIYENYKKLKDFLQEYSR
jgi:DNA polymerase